MGTDRSLIFDIGAHSGEDTDFYLGKGFRVVAVEANPALADKLRSRFEEHLDDGRLEIVEKAIGNFSDSETPFYVNTVKDDWSSTDKATSSKNLHDVEEIRVGTTSLTELFKTFGVPYFMKVDVEMSDTEVVRSMLVMQQVPNFVSVEVHDPDIFGLLVALGYNRFQVVNQLLNGLISPVNPAREGIYYWPGQMGGYHSGLFGEELPPEDWIDFKDAFALYLANQQVARFGLTRASWLDVHARRV